MQILIPNFLMTFDPPIIIFKGGEGGVAHIPPGEGCDEPLVAYTPHHTNYSYCSSFPTYCYFVSKFQLFLRIATFFYNITKSRIFYSKQFIKFLEYLTNEMLSIANEQFPICEPSSSKIFKSETFPWSDLPNELRVQVMKQLSRRDINSCRRVSRMMNEIVRLNERVLRRRCLDFVCLQRVGQGRMELRMRSDDEGQRRAWRVPCKRKLSEDDKYKTKEKVLYPCQRLDSSINSILCRLPSICDLPFSIDSRLREVMKESDVELFLLNEMKVSDSLLSAILTAFRSTGCRINRVSFELCSFKMLSPHSLIRFLTAIDPVEVTFCLIREASTPHFGRDLFRFLTSRRFFDVSEVVDDIGNDVCLGIDDDILKVSECPTFRVGRGNLITQKGVHEFCESIRSGKRMVQDVRIETETPVSEDVTTMDVTNTSFKIEIKSTNIIEIRNECISEHVY